MYDVRVLSLVFHDFLLCLYVHTTIQKVAIAAYAMIILKSAYFYKKTHALEVV